MRNFNFKALVRRVISTDRKDLFLITNNLHRMEGIYAKGTTSAIGRKQADWIENGEIPIVRSEDIKDSYNISTGYSQPRIDYRLFSIIAKSYPGIKRTYFSLPTKKTVAAADKECIRNYTVPSRSIRRSVICHLCKCGIRSAKQLGIVASEGFKTYSTSSTHDSVNSMIKNTAAGIPFIGSRFNRKPSLKKNDPIVIEDTITWLDSFRSDPNFYKIMKLAAVFYHRFQPSIKSEWDYVELKIRQVWCIPFRVVALEYMFFGKIINDVILINQTSEQAVYSAGLNNQQISSKMVQGIIKSCLNRNDETYCVASLDYSKFDWKLHSILIDIFFACCELAIRFKDKIEMKCYDLLRMYVKFTPLIHEGELYVKKRGVASGLLITNLIDTFANMLLYYAAHDIAFEDNWLCDLIIAGTIDYARTQELDNNSSLYLEAPVYEKLSTPISGRFCGDDVLSHTTIKHIQVLKQICNSLGMSVSEKFQSISKEASVFFLGRYWTARGEPDNSDFYMAVHIIVRSKWYNKEDVDFDISAKLELYRVLSICAPLKSGLNFIRKTFSRWKPLVDFVHNDDGFYYLKEWPSDGYVYKDKASLGNWRYF